ncbi:MAG: metallophosphoesterase, partial [Acidobacteria bacterium]|nr:metallophosphoesterase [Acidobacteriota bacterium]
MKRLIVGDIHGCFDELLALLDRAALAAEDEIIALGDLVDRGPASPRVVDFFQRRSNARSLMGNHEWKHLLLRRDRIDPAPSQELA